MKFVGVYRVDKATRKPLFDKKILRAAGKRLKKFGHKMVLLDENLVANAHKGGEHALAQNLLTHADLVFSMARSAKGNLDNFAKDAVVLYNGKGQEDLIGGAESIPSFRLIERWAAKNLAAERISSFIMGQVESQMPMVMDAATEAEIRATLRGYAGEIEAYRNAGVLPDQPADLTPMEHITEGLDSILKRSDLPNSLRRLTQEVSQADTFPERQEGVRCRITDVFGDLR